MRREPNGIGTVKKPIDRISSERDPISTDADRDEVQGEPKGIAFKITKPGFLILKKEISIKRHSSVLAVT